MVWLRRIEAHDERETRCLVCVDDLGAFREGDGGVGAHVALEWMAQTVAAHAGLERRNRGEPPTLGLLLGSKHVRFARPAYTRGEAFRVVAVRGWGGEQGAASFDCRVESLDAGVRVAEARLSCFVPGDDSAATDARGDTDRGHGAGEMSLDRGRRTDALRTESTSGGAR
jgi:predicted hotdog family 3-hydroxylacyl-ACP dehydratase